MNILTWALAPQFWFGKDLPPTSWMEIAAVIFTALSVFGATRLKIAQYPVGIVATILYSFIFLDAKLYSSLALNIYFTVIQLYGWYFWMWGGNQVTKVEGPIVLKEPPIGNWGWDIVAYILFGSAMISFLIIGPAMEKILGAQSAFADSGILCLSVAAQFLLDRKQLKSWVVWGTVNVLSVIVYGFQQHLIVSGALYGILFFNAIYGYTHWRKEMAKQVTFQ